MRLLNMIPLHVSAKFSVFDVTCNMLVQVLHASHAALHTHFWLLAQIGVHLR